MNRRTKIVCTLGPATSTRERLRTRPGRMDVARLNLSHGTHDDHRAILRDIRAGLRYDRPRRRRPPRPAGPKIRLGEFEGGEADLAPAARSRSRPRRARRRTHAFLASTTYSELAHD